MPLGGFGDGELEEFELTFEREEKYFSDEVIKQLRKKHNKEDNFRIEDRR